MCIRWLVERTAGSHLTSLRAGSPLRYAPVGMTIHILVRDASAQEDCHADKKSQTPSVAEKSNGELQCQPLRREWVSLQTKGPGSGRRPGHIRGLGCTPLRCAGAPT
jgi:hypothetical protein